MSRTPLIRRLVAIAVAAAIPFGAATSSAHAAIWPTSSQISAAPAYDGPDYVATQNSFSRSSWS
jgi:hypothetical protein